MPYIREERRELMELLHCIEEIPANSGELNYAFTMIIVEYVQHHGLVYSTINDIVGALEGAKAEFQRRVVASYEDRKIQENGDVYPEYK